jgi:hypothetical protein
MNRTLLEQPFSPEQIKQRAGNFGQTLDYIEGHAVIQRLNDAFDGQWSFSVKSHEILESEVVILGELMAEGIVKMQFGSSSITRAKNSGEIISLADDLKAASTDSMKKCATMFGVGLHLYSGHTPTSKPVAKPTPPVIENDPFSPDVKGTLYCPASPRSVQFSGGGNGGPIDSSNNINSGNGSNENGRLSNKQYNYLLNLAVERGLTKKDIDQKAIGEYGSAVAYLSKNDASAMIKHMLSN